MQVPPNLGIEYTNEFVNLYIDLAEENNLPLIPLILDAVGGDMKNLCNQTRFIPTLKAI